jgi:hypothetical protein
LEVLPPTIADAESLGLIGEILRVRPTVPATSALRAKLFRSSWQQLVDFASGHAVLMPCILALKQRALLLPLPRSGGKGSGTHVTSVLEDAYARHLDRRAALREQLAELVAALNRHGIVPLLIKGGRYLTDDSPPWSEARDMRDLDILVPRGSAAAAIAALEAEGYAAASREAPTDQHLPEMRRSDRCSTVEPHVEALGYAGRRIVATDLLWSVSVAGCLADRQLRVLPPAWHLLHALLHHQVSDRGYARHVLALKDVWEFACHADGLPAEDWRAIAHHMQRAGAADILGSLIAQAELLFGLVPPASVTPSAAARAHAEKTLRRAQSPTWLRRFLFAADKLSFAFAPQTLAARYPGSKGNPLGVAGRHIGFLLRLHGADTLRRLRNRRDGAN